MGGRGLRESENTTATHSTATCWNWIQHFMDDSRPWVGIQCRRSSLKQICSRSVVDLRVEVNKFFESWDMCFQQSTIICYRVECQSIAKCSRLPLAAWRVITQPRKQLIVQPKQTLPLLSHLQPPQQLGGAHRDCGRGQRAAAAQSFSPRRRQVHTTNCRICRDRLNLMLQVAWMLQIRWGWSSMQEQEQNSPNLEHRL